ncbi:hypothetical protein J3R83DRAFT_3957 [Lanmaoa asiatica]|nr:hypothetical protein J3R83DRAFT_3957 [Lanmaoa asiatica]
MSAYGTTRNHAGSAFATSASITLFRRLSWEGTVPLEIRVDPKELPANSDRGLECYYIQAPRVSYLPLLMPELRRFLMDIVFDEAAGKLLKEEDWWFESEEGTLLKWYVWSFSACRRIPWPTGAFGVWDIMALWLWTVPLI